eukprot:m.269495 g.269495  ORF g.269495 m.269495 type:complete len:241 (+) comp84593_c0_seq1:386-1108(+)
MSNEPENDLDVPSTMSSVTTTTMVSATTTQTNITAQQRTKKIIVFLDVDGVLNSGITRAIRVSPQERFFNNFKVMCGVSRRQTSRLSHTPHPDLVANLKHIITQTNAKIVLSSTWRLIPETLEELRDVLKRHGLEAIGSTQDLEGAMKGDRVDEIMLWNANYTHSIIHSDSPTTSSPLLTTPAQTICDIAAHLAWVAIDDLDLCLMNTKMNAANFVHTDDHVGLTKEKAEEAITKLLQQA